jgi:hypothetical protein
MKLQSIFNFSASPVVVYWKWRWILFPLCIYLSIQLTVFSTVYHKFISKSFKTFVYSTVLQSNIILMLLLFMLTLEGQPLSQFSHKYLFVVFPLIVNLIVLTCNHIRNLIQLTPLNMTPTDTLEQVVQSYSERTLFKTDSIVKVCFYTSWTIIILVLGLLSKQSSSISLVNEDGILSELPWEQCKIGIVVLSCALFELILLIGYSSIRFYFVEKLYDFRYTPKITGEYFENHPNNNIQTHGTRTLRSSSSTDASIDGTTTFAHVNTSQLSPFALIHLHALMQRAQQERALQMNPSVQLDQDLANVEHLIHFLQRVQRMPRNEGVPRTYVNRLPTFHYSRDQSQHEEHFVDQVQCAICLENFENEDVLRMLPCFHRFHVNCIDDWFNTGSTCPICRTSIIQSNTDGDHLSLAV